LTLGHIQVGEGQTWGAPSAHGTVHRGHHRAACKVKVQEFSAAGDKLEDAAVCDVPAASHFEVLQGGAVLAEQSQSSISQPGAA